MIAPIRPFEAEATLELVLGDLVDLFGHQPVRLEPHAPIRIYRVRAWRSNEHGFDYFQEPTLV